MAVIDRPLLCRESFLVVTDGDSAIERLLWIGALAEDEKDFLVYL